MGDLEREFRRYLFIVSTYLGSQARNMTTSEYSEFKERLIDAYCMADLIEIEKQIQMFERNPEPPKVIVGGRL